MNLPEPSPAPTIAAVDPAELGRLRDIVAKRVPGDSIDEVLQETALAVMQSDSVPNDPIQRSRWLCGVAIRQCVYYWRRESKHSRCEKMDQAIESSDLSDQQTDPFRWLLERESQQQVRDAIMQLDDESRQLLIHKFLHRRTYPQIASALSVTRHIAEYRVGKAIAAFKSLMNNLNVGESDND